MRHNNTNSLIYTPFSFFEINCTTRILIESELKIFQFLSMLSSHFQQGEIAKDFSPYEMTRKLSIHSPPFSSCRAKMS